MRKFRILGFSYSLNAPAHREPPNRNLSAFPEPQRGGDAVERIVSGRAHLPFPYAPATRRC